MAGALTTAPFTAADEERVRMSKRKAVAMRAQELMTRDLTRTYTIDELAGACGTSASVLKDAFKTTFGLPVYTWYRAYRIRRACELMVEQPHVNIAQIAAQVGYANPSKFSHAFNDVMGMNPRTFRGLL